MAWPSRLLSFQGRVTRRQFWLGHLIILGGAVLAGLVGGLLIGVASLLLGAPGLALWGPAVLAVLVTAAALVGEFSLVVRRMRDREGSPWWLAALASMALLADILVGYSALAGGRSVVNPLTIALTLFALGLWGWIIVELGILGSSHGQDRFGARPAALLRRLAGFVLSKAGATSDKTP